LEQLRSGEIKEFMAGERRVFYQEQLIKKEGPHLLQERSEVGKEAGDCSWEGSGGSEPTKQKPKKKKNTKKGGDPRSLNKWQKRG